MSEYGLHASPILPNGGYGNVNPIITLVIIAKDEENAIEHTIRSLAGQSLWDADITLKIIFYFNGCTDRTVQVARHAVSLYLKKYSRSVKIVDTKIGGKSRSWNAVVHHASDLATDYFLFLDADIVFASNKACLSVLELLWEDRHCVAVSGRPMKSFALKKHKTLLDRISLSVSEHNRAQRSINGSLYCMTAQEARNIFLPTQNPAEDGFLNAMIHTKGFSCPPDAMRVNQADSVTHYYKPAAGLGIFYHERRVLIGTIINRWIFEHLWDLKSEAHLGTSIAYWNDNDPAWVQKIVDRHVDGKRWVIPTGVLFWRMPDRKQLTMGQYLRRLPLSLAATAFNIMVCVAANRRIKAGAAAGIW
jgi:glycosyltransferase involved in cell wall biosynthesis